MIYKLVPLPISSFAVAKEDEDQKTEELGPTTKGKK